MSAHHNNNNMESTWGAAASHAEHHIHDCIRYTVEGQTRTGTIIWICTPAQQAKQFPSTRYVVQPDDKTLGLDLVCPGNILISDGRKQQPHTRAETPGLEQSLIEMLATLSIPIIVKVETDDNGQPFYVWHLGESTPGQPFGGHVGTDPQLMGALKLALETLIRRTEQ